MTGHEHLVSVPPDGGWGWVIMFVSCCSIAAVDIPSYGFQVVEDDLMKMLGLSAPEVSIFFSTYTGCMFFMGPIAGGVCNRFGFRLTNIIGCILMIIGLASSYFVSDYIEFLITYGVISGCGTSFIMLMANVATGFWFEKKRTIVFGIVGAANQFSVFSVALSNYVADKFGWRHCFTLWAGLIVILLFLSLLLAPPPMMELQSDDPLVGPTKTVDVSKVTIMIPLEYDKFKEQKMSEKKMQKMGEATGIPVGRVSRPSITPSPRPAGFGRLFSCCLCGVCCQQSIGSRPLYRKDIFYTGSIDYASKKAKVDRATFTMTMSKLPTSKDVKQELECHCIIPEAITRPITEMLDWSLFCSPIFLLILLSSIFVYSVRYIPFLLLKKHNLPYMDHASAAQTVSMMGFGSVTSRFSIGFILYFCHNISALTASIFVKMAGGTAICCLTLLQTVTYQMVMCFLAGACTGVTITLRSLIIIDLLGINKLTSCTGLLFFLQGFASFVGMPIAAILTEKTGNYSAAFYFSGAGYLLAGFCSLCLFVCFGRSKTHV